MSEITTATELNALPDGSVVLDRHAEAWQMVAHDPSNPETAWAPTMFSTHDEIDEPLLASELTEHAPLTALLRRDVQPVTETTGTAVLDYGDDTIERLAEAYVAIEEFARESDDETAGKWFYLAALRKIHRDLLPPVKAALEDARAGVAAAGAGEALRCERDLGCIVAHSVNCCEKNGVDREPVDDFLSALRDASQPSGFFGKSA
jgi:hypothetical protein